LGIAREPAGFGTSFGAMPDKDYPKVLRTLCQLILLPGTAYLTA